MVLPVTVYIFEYMHVRVCTYVATRWKNAAYITDMSPVVRVGVCVLQDSSSLSLQQSLACDVPEKNWRVMIETAQKQKTNTEHHI